MYIVDNVMAARKLGKVTPFKTDLEPVELTKEQQEKANAYVPTKRGKRSYCISWNKEVRIRYLSFIKASKEQCAEVLRLWRQGEYWVMWPAGFFPPNAIRRMNPVFGHL